ncbi:MULTISPECIES: helix-turn-helix domain-containing protein [unclassified Micromonospora]|uniref:helix-turn-helix domain-containing protein n=1 Tax=unclassified Micromonospora TaxID=2617518 RepID=UPI00364032D0
MTEHADVRELATLDQVVAELVALTAPGDADRVRALAEQAQRVPRVWPGQSLRTYRHELARLREEHGLSLEAAAQWMDWSTSKLRRVELGAVGISVSDMRMLTALYQADPATAERLAEQARRAWRATRQA